MARDAAKTWQVSFLDETVVVLDGPPSAIVDYLAAEYAPLAVAPSRDGHADIRIALTEDRADPESSDRHGASVASDRRGVFLHDGQDRCLRLDFASLSGECWRATCDPDFDPPAFDRLLLQLIQLRLLCRGKALLPAAAAERRGATILVPGSRRSGKTNLLLGLLAEGARFIGDDWAALDRGGLVQGLGKRLHLSYRTIEAFPDLAQDLPEPAASLVGGLAHLRGGEAGLDPATLRDLEARVHLEARPETLLGQQPVRSGRPVDQLLLLERRAWNKSATETREADRAAMAESLTALAEQQIEELLAAYRAHRAETGRRAEVIDSWRRACTAILGDALHRCATWRVLMPESYVAETPPRAIRDLLDGTPDPDRQGGVGRAISAGPRSVA